MQENLAERLTEIMKKYHVAPAQINLEITETAAAHSDMLENNIKILHKQGIEFSLDDYGSGYSNTDYLFRFPFRIVKIDKTILWEAFKNEKAMIALRNTIRMIKELGLEIVVEGVENQEYVDYLTEQHCNSAGIFLFQADSGQRFLRTFTQGKCTILCGKVFKK